MTDRETGKQKGFAFIEYYEAQTAQSAVRNLDQADLTGRKLKVTFAQKDIDTVMRQSRGIGCFLTGIDQYTTFYAYACHSRRSEEGDVLCRSQHSAAQDRREGAHAPKGIGGTLSLCMFT